MSAQRLHQQIKNVYHFFQAYFWRLVYGLPDKSITIYGITGTNGKTTTCYVLAGILAAEYGVEHVGMLTTVVFRVGKEEVVNETKLTTLPSRLVYQYLKKMKQEGVTHVVIEMTSHALDQNRLAGIKLGGAIILNIAREHLDYHRTMESYTKAKIRIIHYLEESATLVYKGDDKCIERELGQFPISQPPPRLWPAGNFQFPTVTFTAEQSRGVTTPLEGEVNQENVLAASLLAKASGVSQKAIDEGIASVKQVPGRMEWIETNTGFQVLIDYAVTPDALERLYSEVKSKTSGRILALLGAAGLRDRGKRPAMAETVARYADILVLTREDPWTEPEEQIFQDLEKGLQNSSVRWQRITDRKEAIRFLLEQARSGDVVVVTGKGAETGMGIGKEIVPWNDRVVIEQLLCGIQ